jgi:hypothetical protein
MLFKGQIDRSFINYAIIKAPYSSNLFILLKIYLLN